MILLWPFTLAAIGITCLYFLRRYCAGSKCPCWTRLDGKVVIVTGATSGIGREVSRELAHRGASLFLGCRDMAKAQKVVDEIINESGNTAVSALHLDLNSMASIHRFVDKFKTVESRLDVLVNNAGVFYLPYQKNEDGMESVFAINYLGHFLLTMLLLDTLRLTDFSRIINVSSGAYKQVGSLNLNYLNQDCQYSKWTAYSQSKLSQILFTRKLSKHLKGSSVSVYSVDPGSCRTDIYRHFPFLRGILGAIQAPLRWLVVKTATEGAQTVIHCAVSKDVLCQSGKHFYDCQPQKLYPAAMDDQSAQDLWNQSVKWSQLL